MAQRETQYQIAHAKRAKNYTEHAGRAHKRQLNAIHDKARTGAAETLKGMRDNFIRDSNETSPVLAARYNLSPSAIRKIRLKGEWT